MQKNDISIRQAQQQRRPSLYPEITRLRSRIQIHRNHKRTAALRIIITRARENLPAPLLGAVNGPEMDRGHRAHQLHGQRFAQTLAVAIPAAALQKCAAHVNAPDGRRINDVAVLLHEHAELPRQIVDGNLVLAGGRLQHGRQEAGRKREGGQPEEHRRPCGLRPLSEVRDAQHQIAGPRAERLQRGVRGQPDLRHATLEHRIVDVLQFGGHDDQALDAALQIGDAGAHVAQQNVVAFDLLQQDDVQGGFFRANQFRCVLVVDDGRDFRVDVGGQLCDLETKFEMII